MKRLLLLLLCLMLPAAALAEFVATQDIQVYQIEPANCIVYSDGVIPAGAAYTVIGVTYPAEGTSLGDYFVTSAPIQWGHVSYQDNKMGLIVMNPDVILQQRTYSELEAVAAEARHRLNGCSYPFTPWGYEDAAPATETALVICHNLTIREQPDTRAKGLVYLSYGDTITCTGNRHPGWLEATANGQTGWVRREFLLLSPQYITFETETPVLAWPSPDAPWVGLLDAGTTSPVLGEYNGYTVISLRGASGFVAK